mmetsp:Transcript_29695/g.74219  ORF Transcript_29695/g.74219 Transcript_29695/m.74219 type:complete len:396 (+) Transcript_29695:474-1661(+)
MGCAPGTDTRAVAVPGRACCSRIWREGDVADARLAGGGGGSGGQRHLGTLPLLLLANSCPRPRSRSRRGVSWRRWRTRQDDHLVIITSSAATRPHLRARPRPTAGAASLLSALDILLASSHVQLGRGRGLTAKRGGATGACHPTKAQQTTASTGGATAHAAAAAAPAATATATAAAARLDPARAHGAAHSTFVGDGCHSFDTVTAAPVRVIPIAFVVDDHDVVHQSPFLGEVLRLQPPPRRRCRRCRRRYRSREGSGEKAAPLRTRRGHRRGARRSRRSSHGGAPRARGDCAGGARACGRARAHRRRLVFRASGHGRLHHHRHRRQPYAPNGSSVARHPRRSLSGGGAAAGPGAARAGRHAAPVRWRDGTGSGPSHRRTGGARSRCADGPCAPSC